MNIKPLKIAALTVAASGLTVAPSAMAAPASHSAAVSTSAYTELAPAWADTTAEHKKRGRGHGHGHDRYYDDDRYGRSDYGEPIRRDTRIWRARDGRYYCKKDDGTTGLLIGAGVGGLIGHEVAGRGDRTLGAILGAAGGALLGREIDRRSSRCR
ncbi:glycine zipper 2TM domain-containing protein [Qipengyuania atrilutea]|nr:glycine zipper 2TM domain-containing protein [Actirhodobacter atriluteus]